jgi:carbamoyl-phosphate synthase small subunit
MTATRQLAHLVLADGEVFEGEAVAASSSGGLVTGELVFNTVLSGYQEVITDPSYAGQVVAFTYPHIGNYGTNPFDDESWRPWCRAVVVRDVAVRPSSWRSQERFESFLLRHGLPGITGVDTRRLTRHVRDVGAIPCALGTAGVDTLAHAARAEPGTTGADLVREVTRTRAAVRGDGPWRVVAYDFGVKETMLRHLEAFATTTVVPAAMAADEALSLAPDGVFLSNGPGDPAALDVQAEIVAGLLGRVPVFGICLGHQLLARALGASTYKLPFGHHGGNHPVRRVDTGTVHITSQNHNYAVDPSSLPRTGAAASEVTHVNLNDGVVEGIRAEGLAAFGVQYHPEAGPGPHDARGLFVDFVDLMARGRRSGRGKD